MSKDSPYFFMREFSNEELSQLLINKVKELKQEKNVTQELNVKLQENLVELEETSAKLEETKEELRLQRDSLAEEVKQKTKEVIKLERLSAIGELSARIAHDLRNPLNVIKNSAELLKLQDKKSDEKTKMHWERLNRALYRITHQVNDVLDYVKMTPLKKQNTSISTILQDTIERINIPPSIKIELPKNDFTIPCDAERLEIVFVNLFLNSVQAIGNNPGKVIIKISDDPTKNNFILIEFNDTGPGIPRKLIPKIFDPLFTTRQIGTGLGLPSCKNIVEKHSGTINVKPNTKKGATFLIRLPKKTEWESIEDEDNKQPVKVTSKNTEK